MANWLQKILPPPSPRGRSNLPVNMRRGGLPQAPFGSPLSGQQLPNASIIYGVAASMLIIIALYFMLFGHRPFAGFLLLLLAACFLGFALHFLKYHK